MYLALLLLFANISLSQAQQSIPMPDGLGNVWVISGTRVLKIDQKGIITATYSNISIGEPYTIDASDPFRVLVFFRNSQKIMILSNDATPIGQPFGLSAIIGGESSSVCRSARGGIWVLNDVAGEVILLNNQMQPTGQKIFLNPKYFPMSPSSIVEGGGMLYLGLNGKGIARFDTFGSALPTLNYTYDLNSGFRVENDRIWLKQDGKIFYIDPTNLNTPPKALTCSCPTLPFVYSGKIRCFNGTSFSYCH